MHYFYQILKENLLKLFISGSPCSQQPTFWVLNMNLHVYYSVNVELLSIDPPQGEGFEGGHEVIIQTIIVSVWTNKFT